MGRPVKAQYKIGDRVTVTPRLDDPLELTLHTHVVVVDVQRNKVGSPLYAVGHPGLKRRYEWYMEYSLAPGWVPVLS
ncbi:hypothetical protein [Actinoplanes sp. N902-109]|uniref:hypothetical protein n=1 Tax=Actinoplanes sp. (strain N902-109) TaxID=649831 RepID=UPI0003293727|nr:hypothetical protein [Actinoplanes sp. N902-109]AGL13894.1 hypothetical protein L083_0384 [Actinoplanes sp. N902-109]